MNLKTERILRNAFQNLLIQDNLIFSKDWITTSVVGVLTIISFLVTATDIVVHFIQPTIHVSNKIVQLSIDTGRWLCHLWSAYAVFVRCSTEILGYITDPITIFMRIIKANTDEIVNPDHKINWETNSFGVRAINKNKIEDEINYLASVFQNAHASERKSFHDWCILISEWILKCPECISIFMHGNKDIGIVGMLPLNNSEDAVSHLHEDSNRFKIGRSMISKRKSKRIFLHTIYVQPEFRNQIELQQRIVHCLLYKIAFFTKNETNVIIYARGVAVSCKSFLKKLGFSNYKKRMVLDFKKYRVFFKNVVCAKMTIDIIRKIHKTFEKAQDLPACICPE